MEPSRSAAPPAHPRQPSSSSARDIGLWVEGLKQLVVGESAATVFDVVTAETRPTQGFGKLWQRTYRARLRGVAADAHVQVDADGASLTVTTPAGHPFAGLSTLAVRRDGADLLVEIASLARSREPLTELGIALGVARRREDHFWTRVLHAFAAEFGPGSALDVEKERIVFDPRRQWQHWRSLGHTPSSDRSETRPEHRGAGWRPPAATTSDGAAGTASGRTSRGSAQFGDH